MKVETWVGPSGKRFSSDDDVTITIKRHELHTFHQICELAMLHPDERTNKSISRARFLKDLISIKEKAQIAIWDHDEVPKSERGDPT